MEKGRTFIAYDDNNNEIECEIIMSYICEKNNNIYVFYTDNNYDTDGSLNLYASRYLGEENGELQLESIEDEKEWSLLDEALELAKKGIEEQIGRKLSSKDCKKWMYEVMAKYLEDKIRGFKF